MAEWVRVGTAHKLLSEYVELSRSTIYAWIYEGRLEGKKIPGVGLRVSRESVVRVKEDIGQESEP